MKNINASFSILFETPYWIGIFERNDDEGYSVSKFVFGKEPTGPEVYNFITRYYPNRLSYSKPNKDIAKITRKKVNPKKRQREAAKAMENRGVSTKAQEALKLQYEENKQERKTLSKLKKEKIEREKFILKQEKKKQKKRGH